MRAADFTPKELAALAELQQRETAFISTAAFARLEQCMFAQRADAQARNATRQGYVRATITDAGRAWQIVPEAQRA